MGRLLHLERGEGVPVDHCGLVVGGHTEGPHFVFLKTVVNHGQVVIWRIRVQ